MDEEITFSFIPNGSFTITLANSCLQKPPYIHFRRKPSEFILYYILEGEFFLKDGEEEYHISENDILILDPSREHYGLKSTECKFAYIHFISDSFSEGKSASAVNLPKYLHIQSSNNVLNIRNHLASLIAIFNGKNPYYEEMSANLLLNTLLFIAMEYKRSTDLSDNKNTKSVEISAKIIDFINGNYSKEINRNTIEEALGYNFDYLNRCFKKQTGYTIIYYLNMVRIERAKELISSGLYTLLDVANFVGFTDVYYFNKVFKKYASVTPGRYKRND